MPLSLLLLVDVVVVYPITRVRYEHSLYSLMKCKPERICHYIWLGRMPMARFSHGLRHCFGFECGLEA